MQAPIENEVVGGLDKVELFAGLSPEAVREIEAMATWQRFAAGQQVFDKDNDTLEVYFVVSGSVRILSYVGDDREVALANVFAGNHFGELACIDRKERSARVVAIEDSVLASIEGPRFLELLLRHPVVALRIIERFTRIIRSLDSRVTDLSTLSEVQRVFVELLRLAQPDDKRPNGRIIADLPSHKDIASFAGTSREAVAQAIGELARDGIVERKGLALVIRDWNKLQLLARASATNS